MSKFRKKPVVIEAIQLGSVSAAEAVAFLGGEEKRNIDWSYNNKTGEVFIITLEGRMLASNTDWIIRGVKGELYPCKPDIFVATYEPVEDPKP